MRSRQPELKRTPRTTDGSNSKITTTVTMVLLLLLMIIMMMMKCNTKAALRKMVEMTMTMTMTMMMMMMMMMMVKVMAMMMMMMMMFDLCLSLCVIFCCCLVLFCLFVFGVFFVCLFVCLFVSSFACLFSVFFLGLFIYLFVCFLFFSSWLLNITAKRTSTSQRMTLAQWHWLTLAQQLMQGKGRVKCGDMLTYIAWQRKPSSCWTHLRGYTEMLDISVKDGGRGGGNMWHATGGKGILHNHQKPERF